MSILNMVLLLIILTVAHIMTRDQVRDSSDRLWSCNWTGDMAQSNAAVRGSCDVGSHLMLAGCSIRAQIGISYEYV